MTRPPRVAGVRRLVAKTGDISKRSVKADLYKPGEVDMLKVETLQLFDKRVDQDLKAQLAKRR